MMAAPPPGYVMAAPPPGYGMPMAGPPPPPPVPPEVQVARHLAAPPYCYEASLVEMMLSVAPPLLAQWLGKALRAVLADRRHPAGAAVRLPDLAYLTVGPFHPPMLLPPQVPPQQPFPEVAVVQLVRGERFYEEARAILMAEMQQREPLPAGFASGQLKAAVYQLLDYVRSPPVQSAAAALGPQLALMAANNQSALQQMLLPMLGMHNTLTSNVTKKADNARLLEIVALYERYRVRIKNSARAKLSQQHLVDSEVQQRTELGADAGALPSRAQSDWKVLEPLATVEGEHLRDDDVSSDHHQKTHDTIESKRKKAFGSRSAAFTQFHLFINTLDLACCDITTNRDGAFPTGFGTREGRPGYFFFDAEVGDLQNFYEDLRAMADADSWSAEDSERFLAEAIEHLRTEINDMTHGRLVQPRQHLRISLAAVLHHTRAQWRLLQKVRAASGAPRAAPGATAADAPRTTDSAEVQRLKRELATLQRRAGGGGDRGGRERDDGRDRHDGGGRGRGDGRRDDRGSHDRGGYARDGGGPPRGQGQVAAGDDPKRRHADGINGRAPCTSGGCGMGRACRFSHEQKDYYKVQAACAAASLSRANLLCEQAQSRRWKDEHARLCAF
jgi:hypothetical protein